MEKNEKRLIEHNIPLKEISKQSVIEKSTRHGNLSTVHAWWARKPLAASRAAIYTSLISTPEENEELEKEIDFIKKFVDWDNTKNEDLMEKARERILDSFSRERPKVLDPFSGGGSMPLEALRLGCDSYSLEYNPVAVFLQKAYIENLLKFPSQTKDKDQKTLSPNSERDETTNKDLLEDFKKWAKWVEKEAKKELKKFYYVKDEEEPIGFYWMRTVPCQRPDCSASIPLTTNFKLAKFSKKDRKDIALKPNIKNGQIEFEILRGDEIDFNPNEGTVYKSKVTCPVCGSTIDRDSFRSLAQEEKLGHRLVAVICQNPDEKGKKYRLANKKDKKIFIKAKSTLEEKERGKSYIDLPSEEIPFHESTSRYLTPRIYGCKSFKSLFNSRQQLSQLTFLQKIKSATKKIEEQINKEYAEVISSLLALIVDRMADYNSSLCKLNSTGGRGVVHTFSRTALPMAWDYMETNPFNPTGANWEAGIIAIEKAFKKALVTKNKENKFDVEQGNAASLPYDDENFDLIVTDPPYYDNIPYAALSDFFYVWLKRSVGDIYPALFSTPLTPKSQEIIEEPARFDGKNKAAKEFFEKNLTKSFNEINRVLKPEGVVTIVFAHKSTEAWETLINSLLNSNLVTTASWPVQTEKAGRLRAQKSAALKSSVFFVCRKVDREEETYFEDIEDEIKNRIEDRLDYFWETGIKGADFFVSAIGPAIEVFGKYKKVKRYSGEAVDVSELLEFIENHVAKYALKRILKAPPRKLDSLTRFYLVWRWTYNNEKIPFDAARMLAQALGLEISDYTGKGKLVKKTRGKIKVLNPKERSKQFLKNPLKKPTSLVDVMHKAAIHWKNGDKNKLNKVLQENNCVDNEHFWRVVQATSEVLPNGDPEKKLLQGLITGKEGLEEAPKEAKLTDFMNGGK